MKFKKTLVTALFFALATNAMNVNFVSNNHFVNAQSESAESEKSKDNLVFAEKFNALVIEETEKATAEIEKGETKKVKLTIKKIPFTLTDGADMLSDLYDLLEDDENNIKSIKISARRDVDSTINNFREKLKSSVSTFSEFKKLNWAEAIGTATFNITFNDDTTETVILELSNGNFERANKPTNVKVVEEADGLYVTGNYTKKTEAPKVRVLVTNSSQEINQNGFRTKSVEINLSEKNDFKVLIPNEIKDSKELAIFVAEGQGEANKFVFKYGQKPNFHETIVSEGVIFDKNTTKSIEEVKKEKELQIEEVKKLIADVEKITDTAKNKKNEILEDKTVSEVEKQDLDKLIKEVESAKNKALEELNKLETSTEKDELEKKLSAIEKIESVDVSVSIELPKINLDLPNINFEANTKPSVETKPVLSNQNNWVKVNETWYYKNSENSNIYKNSWGKINGNWYKFDENGAMLSNKWVKDNENWYWLKESGAMASNEWIKVDGKWFYAMDSGKIAENEWLYIDGSWFYAKSGGYIAENEWVKVDGKWYYSENGGYLAQNKTLKINGKFYSFDKSGAWIK